MHISESMMQICLKLALGHFERLSHTLVSAHREIIIETEVV